MNKPLDLTLSLLTPSEHIRLVKGSLIVEKQKPNFFIRFIRWIRGEYNQVKICGKVHDLAIQYLQNPPKETQRLTTLKSNYEQLIQNKYRRTKHKKTIEQLQKAIEALKIIPKRIKPIPVPKKTPAPVPVRITIKKPVPKPQNIVKNQIRLKKIREISPLENSWRNISDDMKASLNTMNQLPFAAKLASAESLFDWICEGVESKPAFQLPTAMSAAETLQHLMTILGIATPQACLEHGIEPTEAAITKRIHEQQQTWIALATSLGCIRVDEQKLKDEWLQACDEIDFAEIEKESIIIYAGVEFLPLITNADSWIALVFGDKKPLLSWNDPKTAFKRLPDQSIFSQNQLRILGLDTVDAFIKKQISPTTESLKNYLKAHEMEVQKLVMDYLERQNYVKT